MNERVQTEATLIIYIQRFAHLIIFRSIQQLSIVLASFAVHWLIVFDFCLWTNVYDGLIEVQSRPTQVLLNRSLICHTDNGNRIGQLYIINVNRLITLIKRLVKRISECLNRKKMCTKINLKRLIPISLASAYILHDSNVLVNFLMTDKLYG